MKKLKPIQLFEAYVAKDDVLILKNPDHLWNWDEAVYVIALSRLLKMGLGALVGTKIDDREGGGTSSSELICPLIPAKEIYITWFGIVKDSVDIRKFQRHWNSYVSFEDLSIELNWSEYSILDYSLLVDDIEEEEIEKCMSDVLKGTYLTSVIEYCFNNNIKLNIPDELKNNPRIIEMALKNNIDIGLSDDVKDIASTALKGNHKLR